MGKARYTSLAESDIGTIIRYIGSLDPAAAMKMLNQLDSACQRLAEAPGVGQARPDLLPDLRFLPVRSYLVFYKEVAEGIQVLRVLHGSRDYKRTDFIE